MPEYLRGGCGSPVRLDDYYWVYYEQEQGKEQKQASGQKGKRKRMPRACKARRKHTQQGPRKVSRSNQEASGNGIVCITSLEPLCGKYLVWTDSLDLGEAWVGKLELTLVDTVCPLEQEMLGAKVRVASWEERSLDQSPFYYVRTRRPSEESNALDRAWPYSGVDNTRCGKCQGPIRDNFTVCRSCHVSFHDSCLSSTLPLQWLKEDLCDSVGKSIPCLACSRSLRRSFLPTADPETKSIAICIDLGSSHVKVSTRISGEDTPLALGVGIPSSCWYDGTWLFGDYASVVVGHRNAILINPIKRLLLDDPESLKQLKSCGNSTVTDIVFGLLKHIFEMIDSQRRTDFESVSDADLYLYMASPSGMTDAQKTVVLSALQDFERYKPAVWTSRTRSVTVSDLPEPECALWGQLGAELLTKAEHRYQVIDIGGFTTVCRSVCRVAIIANATVVRFHFLDPAVGAMHLVRGF
jgi:hypothetical protein